MSVRDRRTAGRGRTDPRRRDAWAPLFAQTLAPLVANATSLEEAAALVAWKVWDAFPGPRIVFKANQTPLIMSPFQVLKAGYASCTGLSIFLVDALRAVGIPARMVGTPSWIEAPFVGGNHGEIHMRPPRHEERRTDEKKDWVEVHLPDRGWVFTDGGNHKPTPWNQTWFAPHPVQGQLPHAGNHSIYAVSYSGTDAAGRALPTMPLAWNFSDHTVWARDVTARYVGGSERVT